MNVYTYKQNAVFIKNKIIIYNKMLTSHKCHGNHGNNAVLLNVYNLHIILFLP